MTDSTASSDAPETTADLPVLPTHPPVGRPWLAALLAWAWPGLGHLYLRRWGRGIVYSLLILTLVVAGADLDGRLWLLAGNPLGGGEAALSALFTGVSLAMGLPYLVLLGGGHLGDVAAQGYEYGTAFLLTAALMNLLLIFDARDVSRGHKP